MKGWLAASGSGRSRMTGIATAAQPAQISVAPTKLSCAPLTRAFQLALSTAATSTAAITSIDMTEPAKGDEGGGQKASRRWRSEEHTSELQSRLHLVCRLLLEKKKNHTIRLFFQKKKKKTYNPQK